MKRTTILILTFSAALATFAVAGGPGKGVEFHKSGIPRSEGHLERMSVMLDLTKEQKTRIAEILETSRQTTAQTREQVRTDREALRSTQRANAYDQEKVREMAHRLADSRVEMMQERHHIRQQIDAVLTPDQLQKKNEMRELHDQRRSQRHARHQARW